ncbi:MAG TPA: hypothetical protein VMU53_10215 [Candidatus Sulfotelmatobacter sp.]|nr:hypothetical protein [Candidatus Sulfotelmatobacter sp.]
MNTELVDRIARAVLYEGYLLYPYRPSAVKNQQRFNFGVVYPRAYSETQSGTDKCTIQTECLVEGDASTQCTVRVRFLRMLARSIIKANPSTEPSGHSFESVARLEVSGKAYHPWQEACEETIEVSEFSLAALAAQSMQWPFRLSARQDREPIQDQRGVIVGMVLRDKRTITGRIDLFAQRLQDGLVKLTTHISNDSRMDTPECASREQALELALVSTHTILEVRSGAFVSLVDPPDQYAPSARACQNLGTWPILVGAEGQRDTMLSSPIILYDYPQVAPESPGDLFDGAEIDEILSLRILTMTEQEKREMRESDDRARQILERTETLPDEQWMKLHGALRGLRQITGETE